MTKWSELLRRTRTSKNSGQHVSHKHRSMKSLRVNNNIKNNVSDFDSKVDKISQWQIDDSSCWCPSAHTAFKLLMSVRLSSAIWTNISDCDETYNYWEPLHLFLFGTGLQTWEYSPQYALRSYAYIWLHAIPAKTYLYVLPKAGKPTVFYFIRCLLAALCAFSELQLYCALRDRISACVARLSLAFLLLGAGTFLAAPAFLPSSFSMMMTSFAIALWLRHQYFWATFLIAVSALLGWPFAAILGLPIAVDMLLIRKNYYKFMYYALLSGFTICSSMSSVDSFYFGKRVLAPLNIVLYNVLTTSQGSTLYGVEPVSYYIKNLLLNLNLVFPLAVISSIIGIISYHFKYRAFGWIAYIPVLFIQVMVIIWLAIFFNQPHKEERFLFPVYPLLCICAAVTLHSICSLLRTIAARVFSDYSSDIVCLTIVLAYGFLSLCRVTALYRNYHAPITVYMDIGEKLNITSSPDIAALDKDYHVCVGKEWYRFPSNFFMPDSRWKIHFVQSEFKGLLPASFPDLPLPDATRTIPETMNDQNHEEFRHYWPIERCDFFVDFDNGRSSSLEPNLISDTINWRRISCYPFLIAEQSHPVFRAFYLPYFSQNSNLFGPYCLLQRI